MKKFILALLFLPLFTLSQDKVKFLAAGVTCSMCSSAIHRSLQSDKAITFIAPNLETQEWYLEYEPKGSFKLESLKKRVEDAGFSLAKVWLNNELILENKKRKK